MKVNCIKRVPVYEFGPFPNKNSEKNDLNVKVLDSIQIMVFGLAIKLKFKNFIYATEIDGQCFLEMDQTLFNSKQKEKRFSHRYITEI
jgi:hypothetical protein